MHGDTVFFALALAAPLLLGRATFLFFRLVVGQRDSVALPALLSGNLLIFLTLLTTLFFAGECWFRFAVDTTDGDAQTKATARWYERHWETNSLGLRDDIAHFAVDVSHLDDPTGVRAFDGRGEFVELRSVGPLLSRDDGGILAYAKGITHWHARHRFCGVCGTATEMREAGHVRICIDDQCASQHFPRTDPAVIMLVSQGDRVVLGRKSEWQKDMYSTLAGFVEPGESLEDAVAREVWEEVRIEVANVRYHSSQPWPFPASLMLGFYADAVSDRIAFNRDELEDARWFTRRELADGGAGIKHRPRSDSIARRLIQDWVASG